MNSNDNIAAKFNKAFGNHRMQGAVSNFSYVSTSSTYDTSTGVVTATDTKTTSRGLPLKYSVEEVNANGGTHLLTDVKLTVLQADMSVSPDEEDYIIGGGRRWNIEEYRADPANVTWEFRLRSVETLDPDTLTDIEKEKFGWL